MYTHFVLYLSTCTIDVSLYVHIFVICVHIHSIFGDFRELELHYFLADDTIEILEKIPANSGRDGVSMFLKRAKLPKVIILLIQLVSSFLNYNCFRNHVTWFNQGCKLKGLF